MSTTEEKPAVEAPIEAPASTSTETPAEATVENPAEAAQEGSVAGAQLDGSGPPGNGSAFAESEFKVEVKLADRQKDPNDPLFSAKSFEELKLYVTTS
jgi:ATP-dependent RNA helicase DDX19/DBP5